MKLRFPWNVGSFLNTCIQENIGFSKRIFLYAVSEYPECFELFGHLQGQFLIVLNSIPADGRKVPKCVEDTK